MVAGWWELSLTRWLCPCRHRHLGHLLLFIFLIWTGLFRDRNASSAVCCPFRARKSSTWTVTSIMVENLLPSHRWKSSSPSMKLLLPMRATEGGGQYKFLAFVKIQLTGSRFHSGTGMSTWFPSSWWPTVSWSSSWSTLVSLVTWSSSLWKARTSTRVARFLRCLSTREKP